MHHRASQWFEHHGSIEEAVKHALAARDFEGAARLVEKLADELWERGEPSTLLNWFGVLPEEQVFARPCLCSFFAWALFISGQNQAAERLLQAAEEALDLEAASLAGALVEGPDPLGELDIREERGRVAAIRASLAFRRGDAQGVFRFARPALEYLSEESLLWRSIMARDLGNAQDLGGDTVAAARTLSGAVKTSNASGNVYLILSTSLDLGTTLMAQGRLKQAYELCQELLKLAEERGVLHTEMAGCLYDELGLILCEWNHSLAEPGGYVRAFVDEGIPMAQLLRQVASPGVAEIGGVSSGYVRSLQTAFEPSHVRQPILTDQPLVEPMSERELEVLRLIAKGLSNREIAQQLIIAVGTVKAHTSAIYRKLDARGRAQAAIRAREMNLL